MSTPFTAITMAMAAVLAAEGVLALATGRVFLLWMPRRVNRPGLWGAGTLLMAAALATARITPFELNILLMLSGAVLASLPQKFGNSEESRPE